MLQIDEDLLVLNSSDSSRYLTSVNILVGHSSFNPCRALIDPGALHSGYGGTWLKDLVIANGDTVTTQHKNICSPLHKTCFFINEAVVADVWIFSINKKEKFECQIEFKILSILDTKPYAFDLDYRKA